MWTGMVPVTSSGSCIMKKKLTMITVNGVTKFVRVPVSKDGKVRVNLHRLFNIDRYRCIVGR